MMDFYNPVRRLLHAARPLHALAKRAQYLVPDLKMTRDVPDLGRFQFRLRRHRWFMGRTPMAGHREHLEFYRRLLIEDRPATSGQRVAYDIGANIGYYTRPLVSFCGATRVVAFEPMSENLDLLRENVRLGKMDDRVRVLDLALSDVDGQDDLQVDDMSGGSAVLNSVSGGAPAQSRRYFGLREKTEQVTVARLDRLIEELRLPLPDFAKIDVEGAEAKVIAGAEQTLRTAKPRLAIALHGEGAARDTIAVLARIGYVALGHTKGESKDRPLAPSDAPTLAENNIAALAEGDPMVVTLTT